MRFVSCLFLAGAAVMAGQLTVGSTKVESIDVSDHGRSKTVKMSAAPVTAVIFVATQCPVSNAYNERMSQLYNDYKSKGVQFVFVNANDTEPAAEVDEHAKSHSLSFPVYKDPQNKLADAWDAQVTPEVYLFDKSGMLKYHGRIDDSRDLSRVQKKDTRAALDAMLSGQTVTAAETKAFGCTIKRARKSS